MIVFLEGAYWFGTPFPNIFWNILDSTYWIQSIRKINTKIFCLFICEVTTIKENFCLTNSVVKPQCILFANKPFLRKILEEFFSSNIPLIGKKISWKNYVKLWKWSLKHTHQLYQNSFLRKSNLIISTTFKMISFSNAQESVKIRLASSKVFLIILSSNHF